MKRLKIRTQTMFGTSHSWAITMQEIMIQFAKMGHDLYIVSTDGYQNLSHDLSQFYNRDCEDPDIDICYTLPSNWKNRFKKNSKLKLSIFNYETSIIPIEWKSDLKHIDYVIPSSSFSEKIMIDNGWPSEKIRMIGLGYNEEQFLKHDHYKIDTKKNFKFLNVSINHYRKNIDKLIRSYYQEFSDKDDVTLILKTSLNKPKTKFECDVGDIILQIQKSMPGKIFPQLIILNERLKNMSGLYQAADCLISTSSSEGFGLPFVEAMASNILVAAPRATGQLDFLNDENSILFDTNHVNADKNIQYWRSHPSAMTYMPDCNDISRKMRFIYENSESLKTKFFPNYSPVLQSYRWENTAQKIIKLYDHI